VVGVVVVAKAVAGRAPPVGEIAVVVVCGVSRGALAWLASVRHVSGPPNAGRRGEGEGKAPAAASPRLGPPVRSMVPCT
jgi:hypothetical protein